MSGLWRPFIHKIVDLISRTLASFSGSMERNLSFKKDEYRLFVVVCTGTGINRGVNGEVARRILRTLWPGSFWREDLTMESTCPVIKDLKF